MSNNDVGITFARSRPLFGIGYMGRESDRVDVETSVHPRATGFLHLAHN